MTPVPVNYPDFGARWLKSGGAKHSNYRLFLQDLCDPLGMPRPQNRRRCPGYLCVRAMQAVRAVVQRTAAPLNAAAVAARFRGSSAKNVQPLLDTLAALAHIRQLENGTTYAT
ncbi:hypothetical protein MTX78_24995 (plasmid) [Hymenobacter tibetensis]|uniref:Uncharacterized protein n=1 Tax=Hymenobacter tibetensis TaxID=497967 RepID=A0ABY4D5J4_9BACT|nr:hypothetical protein [Hymenobacter tibetensis]UOG77623.1 hypothetical protein MTX78_24995 [Hymenobacter tibetensis]